MESYNPATGQFTAWVRIPVLSHSADTVLYLNYGNGGVTVSQENRAGVWDSSYKGVYHLPNGVTLPGGDSTGTGNNATISGVLAGAGMDIAPTFPNFHPFS